MEKEISVQKWMHIDGANFSHIDNNDISLESFKNDSVDLIYSSHFIEYFDRDEIISLLGKWKQVLKKNGILRLAVPDFKACVELYSKLYPLDNFLGPLYGRMRMGDKLIYHKTVFDFKSLKKILKDVGMRDIFLFMIGEKLNMQNSMTILKHIYLILKKKKAY